MWTPKIGDKIVDIETPALVVDLDIMEDNINKMAKYVSQRSVRLRPHAKSHKCPNIASQQISKGAIGICCQTIQEAYAFVNSGVSDVLITNQITSIIKAKQLASLQFEASVAVCIDHELHVDLLEKAASELKTCIPIFVEIDVGGGRCGSREESSVFTLVKYIDNCPHLTFSGIQAYHGPAQHFREHRERHRAIMNACETVKKILKKLRKGGYIVDNVTGGGTGTFGIEASNTVYTEIQPGSYIFMDVDYSRNVDLGEDFQQSLFLLSSVISAPQSDKRIIDVGLKRVSVDSGMPKVAGLEGAQYVKASDEHGILEVAENSIGVGEKIYLIPGHCDPTVNLYTRIVGLRNGYVAAVWPIV